MSRSPAAELAAAERALGEARERLAANRRRRRDLTTEGNAAGDAIHAELYTAGREGRDPDIAEHRARVAEIQAELADLDRLEKGIEAAITDAANGVAAVRFQFAPHFEEKLVATAEKLAQERTKLEQALAAVAEREEDARAEWRVIAAAIPGQTTDLPFEDGATVPLRRPSEPHVGISNFVAQGDWPTWFRDTVRQAANEAARAPREEVSA